MNDFNDFYKNSFSGDQLNDIWAKYQNMGEEERKSEIMGTLIGARNSGELNDETLANYYSTLAPYLSNEQKANLWNIINELKN